LLETLANRRQPRRLGAPRFSQPSIAMRATTLGVAAAIALVASRGSLDSFSLIILTQAFLYAVVVLGVDLLWGYTGILSFGQAAFFAIGGYAVAILYHHVGFTTLTTLAAVGSGVVVAAVVAAGVGWLGFTDRAPALYITVVTFALPTVLVQLLLAGGSFTGSSTGLSAFDTPLWAPDQWYLIAGALLLVVLLASYLLVHSDAGKVLVAIRENESRCQYLGIRTARIKTLLLIGSGAAASIAGAAYAASFATVTPDLGGFLLATQFVVWAALGGRGTLFGPLAVVLAINFITADLSGSLPVAWLLAQGVVFIAVVAYLPGGLASVAGRAARMGRQHIAAFVPAGRTSGKDRPRLVEDLRRPDPSAPDRAGPPALEVKGLSKSFGELSVLKDVSFEIDQGELVSIIGPNGAGKTTLVRCISDGREPTSGSIRVKGVTLDGRRPTEIAALGVGRKFQTASLFEALTVHEALRVSRARAQPPSLFRASSAVALPPAAMRVLEITGLDEALDEKVSGLSHGMKQALELAMVLALEPSLILLDEPTAGLTEHERGMIGNVLVELVASRRLAVVLVEHDLDFVQEISSRMLVLHMGGLVMDGSVPDVVQSELVREVYAG
jgi:branched-chain amino acid transport system permease protein